MPRVEIGSWEEIEAVKIFYNTFISNKIALVNMIQDVAVKLGNINVDVVANALDLFDNPKVKIIDYGITNDTAWEVGLACGGDIRIRLEILRSNG